MKCLYVTDTGVIRDWFPDSARMRKLNPALSIGQSAAATGKEGNISELSDLEDVTEVCAVRRGDEIRGLRMGEQLAMRALQRAQAQST